jgi:hypothetical protein
MKYNCMVYYCPVLLRGPERKVVCSPCRMVYRTDGKVGFKTVCERCKKSLTWARGETPHDVESRIGVPMVEWTDLTVDR